MLWTVRRERTLLPAERERRCTASQRQNGEVRGQRESTVRAQQTQLGMSYRRAAHRGDGVTGETADAIVETQAEIINEQDSRHGHWRQLQRQDELPYFRGEECSIC